MEHYKKGVVIVFEADVFVCWVRPAGQPTRKAEAQNLMRVTALDTTDYLIGVGPFGSLRVRGAGAQVFFIVSIGVIA